MSLIDTITALHIPWRDADKMEYCGWCMRDWPCHTAQLITELERVTHSQQELLSACQFFLEADANDTELVYGEIMHAVEKATGADE